jgi:hypothetical protein
MYFQETYIWVESGMVGKILYRLFLFVNTKAVTEFSDPYMLWGSHCAISIVFRHSKDVKTIFIKSYELTELDRLTSQAGMKWTLNRFSILNIFDR